MIRVLIADDETLLRMALATLLGLEPDIEVVAQAGDVIHVGIDPAQVHLFDKDTGLRLS